MTIIMFKTTRAWCLASLPWVLACGTADESLQARGQQIVTEVGAASAADASRATPRALATQDHDRGAAAAIVPQPAGSASPASTAPGPSALNVMPPAQLHAQVQHAAEQARSLAPATAAAITTMQPQRARTGGLTFTEPSIAEAAATPLIVQRLLTSGIPSAERVALAGALARSGGEFGPMVVALLDVEEDPGVRLELVAALRRVGANDAHTGLLLASHDGDPRVRARMAATAGRRADGGRLESRLVALLADADARVRAEAARAIAALDLEGAFDAVASLLPDASADVRLHAMRALSRLDPARARRLQTVRDLRRDDDARVRNAAEAIVAGP